MATKLLLFILKIFVVLVILKNHQIIITIKEMASLVFNTMFFLYWKAVEDLLAEVICFKLCSRQRGTLCPTMGRVWGEGGKVADSYQ